MKIISNELICCIDFLSMIAPLHSEKHKKLSNRWLYIKTFPINSLLQVIIYRAKQKPVWFTLLLAKSPLKNYQFLWVTVKKVYSRYMLILMTNQCHLTTGQNLLNTTDWQSFHWVPHQPIPTRFFFFFFLVSITHALVEWKEGR